MNVARGSRAPVGRPVSWARERRSVSLRPNGHPKTGNLYYLKTPHHAHSHRYFLVHLTSTWATFLTVSSSSCLLRRLSASRLNSHFSIYKSSERILSLLQGQKILPGDTLQRRMQICLLHRPRASLEMRAPDHLTEGQRLDDSLFLSKKSISSRGRKPSRSGIDCTH